VSQPTASRSLLDNVGQLYANTLFLGNLFEFLALEPKVTSRRHPQPVPPVHQAIRFRAASFC
jgi:ATP-binding cassette subfamily B protein